MGGSIGVPCRGPEPVSPGLLTELERLEELKEELALKAEELQLREEELQLREERLNNDTEVAHIVKAQLSKAPSLAQESAESNEDFPASATEKQVQGMPDKARGLYSSSTAEVLKAVRVYRDLVTDAVEDHLGIILNDGVGTKLVSFLEEGHSRELQDEVVTVLHAVSSPAANFVGYLRSIGSVPLLVTLMASSEKSISEKAMLTLGNVALGGPLEGGCVLNAGVMDRLTSLSEDKERITYPAVWLMSALCREQAHASVATKLLPLLADVRVLESEDTVAEACWALSRLTNPDAAEVCFTGDLLRMGVVNTVLDLVRSSRTDVANAALRTVCNVAAAGEWEMDEVLEMGMLDAALSALRNSGSSAVTRRAALLLQQVVEGEERHQQQFIESVALLRVLVVAVKNNSLATSARHTCATVLMTAAAMGSTEQVAALIPGGIISALWEVLSFESSHMQGLGLEALQNILLAGEEQAAEAELSYNPYCKLMDSLGVFNALEALSASPEHSEWVADIKDTFLEDWLTSKEDLMEEVLTDLDQTAVLWAVLKVQAVLRGKLARIRIQETRQMKAEDALNSILLGEAAPLDTVQEEPDEGSTAANAVAINEDTPSKRKGQLEPLHSPMSHPPQRQLPPLVSASTSGTSHVLSGEEISAIGDTAEEHAAAAKLQARQRGRSARKEVRALRQKQQGETEAEVNSQQQDTDGAEPPDFSGWADDKEMNNAAAKLQAVQRGRSARKKVQELKRLPSHSEELHEMQELKAAQLQAMEDAQVGENGDASAIGDSEEEQVAATKLQAIQRGRQARKQIEEMKEANTGREAPAAE